MSKLPAVEKLIHYKINLKDFGNVRNDQFGKCVKGRDNTNGYLRVCLMNNKKNMINQFIN